MIAADPPPAAVQPAPPEVVVSRRDDTVVIASRDVSLSLSKGAQREQALLRQAIFLTSSVSVVRPSAAEPVLDRYRWTHQAFLQRQVCFSSMTGLFACTEPAVQPLPDTTKGEADVSPLEPDKAPLSEAARRKLTADLIPRANPLFDADRRANVDPVFKAAGVTATRTPTTPR